MARGSPSPSKSNASTPPTWTSGGVIRLRQNQPPNSPTTPTSWPPSWPEAGGNSDPAGRGAAPGGTRFCSFAGLLPDDDADYAAQNTTVQNHSYGSGIENYYGPSALALRPQRSAAPCTASRFFCWKRWGDGLIIRHLRQHSRLCQPDGNFKLPKTCWPLARGGFLFGRVPPLSSRGPAYDGRTKPDLMAFGPSGTSEAAALVSGAAAVLQQAFRKKRDAPPGPNLAGGACRDRDDIAPPWPRLRQRLRQPQPEKSPPNPAEPAD